MRGDLRPGAGEPGLRRALLAAAAEERVLAPLGRAEIAQIVARVAGTVDASWRRRSFGCARAGRVRPNGSPRD